MDVTPSKPEAQSGDEAEDVQNQETPENPKPEPLKKPMLKQSLHQQIHTPALNKRRNATKHIVVQSPTDNIFSPISQKLLGKKRNDPAKVLPDL